MFRFKREKIMPLFLERQMTVKAFARETGVSFCTAERAVQGQKISSRVVDKICKGLNIDALDFLVPPAQVTTTAKN